MYNKSWHDFLVGHLLFNHLKKNIMNTKFSGLILAGLAAFAYYKYSKMSVDEKRNLVSSIKEKGKKLYNEYVPGNVKDNVEKNFM